MNKTKQTIIALTLSLFIIITVNVIYQKYFTTDAQTVYVLKASAIRGDPLSKTMLTESNMTNAGKYINKDKIDKYISNYVIKSFVNPGQIISEDLLILKEEYVKEDDTNFQISIPIKDSSYAVSYKVKRGDKINIYYTSKLNQTGNIIKNYEKKYSSSSEDSYLTCKLLENIYVINTYNDLGKKAIEGEKFKEIIIGVNKDMALMISNLKEQGEFNICLTNN